MFGSEIGGGYRTVLRLAQQHAPGRRAFAIEGTGSYGKGLARFGSVRKSVYAGLGVSCESVLEVGVEGGEAFVPAGRGSFPVVLVVSDREVEELTG